MKKFFMSALMTVALMCGSAQAQVVTVTGAGTSEAEAIKDAKRVAVEQVVGALVKSETNVQNYQLVMDTIKVRAQGYVNSFEILKKSKKGNLVTIEARADVSDAPDSALMKDVELVMNLNDPRMAVVIDYYGDDGSENFKKYPAMTTAAIREQLIKSGFTHVLDAPIDAEYIIVGNLTVNKNQAIRLPNWNKISEPEYQTLETGLSKTSATLDCKIKNVATNEIIGEFRVMGDAMSASENDIQTQAVAKMAADAAKKVREVLSRQAAKTFYNE